MQQEFVKHLVQNRLGNTAAARQAGFAHPNVVAAQLLKLPKIQKAIREEREAYIQASGMTKKKVIDGFAEAIDLGRIKADPIAMIAGWREIGKMCGFYEAQKSELKISVQGQVMVQKLNSMSDAELLQLAEENPEALEGEFNVVE